MKKLWTRIKAIYYAATCENFIIVFKIRERQVGKRFYTHGKVLRHTNFDKIGDIMAMKNSILKIEKTHDRK